MTLKLRNSSLLTFTDYCECEHSKNSAVLLMYRISSCSHRTYWSEHRLNFRICKVLSVRSATGSRRKRTDTLAHLDTCFLGFPQSLINSETNPEFRVVSVRFSCSPPHLRSSKLNLLYQRLPNYMLLN
jgi:hypothetical protein